MTRWRYRHSDAGPCAPRPTRTIRLASRRQRVNDPRHHRAPSASARRCHLGPPSSPSFRTSVGLLPARKADTMCDANLALSPIRRCYVAGNANGLGNLGARLAPRRNNAIFCQHLGRPGRGPTPRYREAGASEAKLSGAEQADPIRCSAATTRLPQVPHHKRGALGSRHG